MEALCTISKDGFAGAAGSPLRLRFWQKQLILRLFARRADGKRRHRVAMIGMPRKNGKSAIASGFGLDGLFFDGRGAEVYSAAAERRQAGIVFDETKRMILANEELKELCRPMRDVIEVPSTNSIYRALSAEAYSKEGLNISRNIVDELHAHPDDELLNVLLNGTGARSEPLTIIITTAGVMTDSTGQDSVCYRFYQHGIDVAMGLVDDPSFFFAWWGAPDGADHTDPEVWRKANPGYGDILNPEDLADAVLRNPENEFRTKRLNQWVAAATAWLPAGSWDACKDGSQALAEGDTVYLGFDGSKGRIDATALVAVRPGNPPFVDLVDIWERPEHASDDWEVPVDEVKAAIRGACKRYHVREILYDPHLWQHAMTDLAAEGLPCVEFPQSPERMIGATQRFYEAVLTRQVAHSGNQVLSQHLRNAVLKYSEKGARIVKESKWSGRRIDAAVAAVMAFDVAAGSRPSMARRWIESMVSEPTEPETDEQTPKPASPPTWLAGKETPGSVFDALHSLPWR